MVSNRIELRPAYNDQDKIIKRAVKSALQCLYTSEILPLKVKESCAISH